MRPKQKIRPGIFGIKTENQCLVANHEGSEIQHGKFSILQCPSRPRRQVPCSQESISCAEEKRVKAKLKKRRSAASRPSLAVGKDQKNRGGVQERFHGGRKQNDRDYIKYLPFAAFGLLLFLTTNDCLFLRFALKLYLENRP
jgi:hypothetical protein